MFKVSFRVENLRCDGKPLRPPPPIHVRKCPNTIDGCDDGPPMATDILPPPPALPGGRDF